MDREEAILAARRMQEYIENHIMEPITLSNLAKACGYSQWHSERLFKDVIGKTPFDYIRALRLSKAAIILRDKKPRIIDVAFDLCLIPTRGSPRRFQGNSDCLPEAMPNQRQRFSFLFRTPPMAAAIKS